MQVALANGSVLIPPLTIGLNQTMCMCQSMQALASSVDPPAPASGSCQGASTCSGVNCILTVPFVGTYSVEVDFEVCQDPPRMLVVVEDSSNSVLLDQYFSTSDTVDVSITPSLSFTLDVVIEHYDYSMIIQVIYTSRSSSSMYIASNLLDTAYKIYLLYNHVGYRNHPKNSHP